MMKISRYGNQEKAHSKYIGNWFWNVSTILLFTRYDNQEKAYSKLLLECFNNFAF